MADDLGERTEEATPKRRREAREEGNIARSTDAASAILLLGAMLVLASGMQPFLASLASMLEKALSAGTLASGLSVGELDELVVATTWESALAALPIAAAAIGIALLAHVWQVGFLVSTKAIEPKVERLDPIKGFGRIFGARGAIKTAMDVVKVALVAWVAFVVATAVLPTIVALPEFGALRGFEEIGAIGLRLGIQAGLALLLLGLADYLVQRIKHEKDLRMTKQQVKDEWKDTDGDPEVKRRRMQVARQLASQRLQAAVPKADVVVTNPEHISVAIQYDPETMAAPRIVAMGADHLAFRIRQIAGRHGIPIVERKPLARALYANAKVGQEIPADHYKAVAEILAYVYRLKGRAVA